MPHARPRGLADRVRAALPEGAEVREVRMFGGLSFMVDGGLAVSAGKDGGAAGPRRGGPLRRPGRVPGCQGGDGQHVHVPRLVARLTASDDDLAFWIAESLLSWLTDAAASVGSRGRGLA